MSVLTPAPPAPAPGRTPRGRGHAESASKPPPLYPSCKTFKNFHTILLPN